MAEELLEEGDKDLLDEGENPLDAVLNEVGTEDDLLEGPAQTVSLGKGQMTPAQILEKQARVESLQEKLGQADLAKQADLAEGRGGLSEAELEARLFGFNELPSTNSPEVPNYEVPNYGEGQVNELNSPELQKDLNKLLPSVKKEALKFIGGQMLELAANVSMAPALAAKNFLGAVVKAIDMNKELKEFGGDNKRIAAETMALATARAAMTVVAIDPAALKKPKDFAVRIAKETVENLKADKTPQETKIV